MADIFYNGLLSIRMLFVPSSILDNSYNSGLTLDQAQNEMMVLKNYAEYQRIIIWDDKSMFCFKHQTPTNWTNLLNDLKGNDLFVTAVE